MTLKRHAFLISVALLVVAGAIAFPIAWGSDVVVAKINLDQLPRNIVGLEGYGLIIRGTRPIVVDKD